MSTYVVSDIHGEYQMFLSLLKIIGFSEQDELFVVGDFLDRGPEPIKLTLDLMGRENVWPILGNHELVALQCLKMLQTEITTESIDNLGDSLVERMTDWISNGGLVTFNQYMKCDKESQLAIIDYLEECKNNPYEFLELDSKKFLLIHTGTAEEYGLLPDGFCYDDPGFITVNGHIPTQSIPENSHPGYIYQSDRHIYIDCGACFPGGRLAAIRLNDMKVFYIEREK